MTLYGEKDGVVRPVLQIAMPRLPRIYAPEGTMQVVWLGAKITSSTSPHWGSLKSVDEPACRRHPEFLKRHHPSGGDEESSLYLNKFEGWKIKSIHYHLHSLRARRLAQGDICTKKRMDTSVFHSSKGKVIEMEIKRQSQTPLRKKARRGFRDTQLRR